MGRLISAGLERLKHLWIGPAPHSPAGALSAADLWLAARNALIVGLLTAALQLTHSVDAFDWGSLDPVIAAAAVFLENILAQRLRDQSPPPPERT